MRALHILDKPELLYDVRGTDPISNAETVIAGLRLAINSSATMTPKQEMAFRRMVTDLASEPMNAQQRALAILALTNFINTCKE